MSSPLVLKLTFENDTRRVPFSGPLTIERLNALATTFFPERKFRFAYTDEDGDSISVSTDADLVEASRSAHAKNPANPILRVTLVASSPATPAAPVPAVSSAPVSAPAPAPAPAASESAAPKPAAAAAAAAPSQAADGLAPLAPFLRQVLGSVDLAALMPQIQVAIQSFVASPQFRMLFAQLNNGAHFVERNVNNAFHAAAAAVSPADRPVHQNITCDGCNAAPITGVRYKCANCPNFDLCEACEARGDKHDANHVFLKINRPTNVPIFRPILPNLYVPGAPFHGFHHGAGPHHNGGRWHCRRGEQGARCPVAADASPAPAAATTEVPAPSSPAAPTPAVAAPRARFVRDATIPDGTAMAPGAPFQKAWLIANDGAAAWPAGTILRFEGGDAMSGVPRAVPLVAPGQSANIFVDMKAPIRAGKYMSYWRLCDAAGQAFGHRIWVDIEVREVSPAVAPAAPVTPPATVVAPAPAVPAPLVTPPAPPAPRFAYQPALDQLQSMGFLDTERNKALLLRYRGDIVRVIQEVLNL